MKSKDTKTKFEAANRLSPIIANRFLVLFRLFFSNRAVRSSVLGMREGKKEMMSQ